MAARAPKAFYGSPHAHGCIRCHVRYEDACHTPDTDQPCTGCAGGLVWQYLIDNMRPRPHCRERSRLANKHEIKTYKLAGGHLWWICLDCSRTFPYDPRTWNET